jgi:hypothetical protein
MTATLSNLVVGRAMVSPESVCETGEQRIHRALLVFEQLWTGREDRRGQAGT